jgi:ribosomal protein L11 methylase PrmA
MAARGGASALAFDADPGAVELNYRQVAAAAEAGVLPLVMDLANPSPSLGWNLAERMSLVERGPADAVLALALVHHLAIGHNLPLELIASFLARLGRHLLIEFVPKSDPQAQRLLRSRADIFGAYERASFERAFEAHFRVVERVEFPGSSRSVYSMVRDV